LLLDVLEQSDGHLDAETLYRQAKGLDPNISLATVYRTLAVFKELGLVEEHRLGREHCYYESVQERPHYHFTCRECGRVIEFDSLLVAQIEQELSEQKGVQVLGVHLHISGYCSECRH